MVKGVCACYGVLLSIPLPLPLPLKLPLPLPRFLFLFLSRRPYPSSCSYRPVGEGQFPKCATREEAETFWAEYLPLHLGRLEKLIVAGANGDRDRFTAKGNTVGELYLWSILHQCYLVRKTIFAGAALAGTRDWYVRGASLRRCVAAMIAASLRARID